MSQLVLLIAEVAKEHLLYLLDFTADFVLTLCYDLDCHDLHQAGKRNHQIKSVRDAQDSLTVDASHSRITKLQLLTGYRGLTTRCRFPAYQASTQGKEKSLRMYRN
jgi:hypothetical protein